MARLTKAKDPSELFVAKATRIISAKGLAGFNARLLAKEAGYSLGSIYTYFNDVNDLILQINGYTLEGIYKKIAGAIENKKGRAKLLAAVNAYFDYANSNRNLWYSVMNFDAGVTPEIQSWYQARVDAVLRLVKEALKPELKRNDNVDEIAALMWSTLQGLWLMHNRESFKTSSKATPKKLLEVMVNKLVG